MERLTKSGTKFQIRRDSTRAYLTVEFNGKRVDVKSVAYGNASEVMDFDDIEAAFNDNIQDAEDVEEPEKSSGESSEDDPDDDDEDEDEE